MLKPQRKLPPQDLASGFHAQSLPSVLPSHHPLTIRVTGFEYADLLYNMDNNDGVRFAPHVSLHIVSFELPIWVLGACSGYPWLAFKCTFSPSWEVETLFQLSQWLPTTVGPGMEYDFPISESGRPQRPSPIRNRLNNEIWVQTSRGWWKGTLLTCNIF